MSSLHEPALDDERGLTAPPPSVIDGLGGEVVAVVAPVSLCIGATVALVRAINPDGGGGGAGVYWAAAAYREDVSGVLGEEGEGGGGEETKTTPDANPPTHPSTQASDSDSTKFIGSLENASIFIAIVAATTFGLVAAFKRGWSKGITVYMALSGFSVFFTLTGAIALQLIVTTGINIDAITFVMLLWNFAAVGVGSLFLIRAPLALRQAYLVETSIVVAFMFTYVPEWTTWALLGGMAAYDLYAVLAPGGPLRALVEEADARGEDIPALIYEGRPRAPPRQLRSVTAASAAAAAASARPGGGGGGLPLGVNFSRVTMARRSGQATPLLQPPTSRASDDSGGREDGTRQSSDAFAGEAGAAPASRHPSSDGGGLGLPDAIKLGLGDFIFYSVLVGRASMYDLLAAAAAALAVVAGLGATLLLLALRRHALPALPISIALGAVFTAAARSIVEPVVIPLAANLVYF